MPTKTSNRRKSGNSRNNTPKKVSFSFEQGERTYPQPIMTGSGKFAANGQCQVALGRLELAEDHLRGLGWRITCTISGDGKFLTSTSTATSVVKNVAYAMDVNDDGEERGPEVPTLKLIGPPGTSIVVVATVTLLYKPNI